MQETTQMMMISSRLSAVKWLLMMTNYGRMCLAVALRR
jgi:hypothetical protein